MQCILVANFVSKIHCKTLILYFEKAAERSFERRLRSRNIQKRFPCSVLKNMNTTYKVEASKTTVNNGTEATLFKVGFGDPAQNDTIVRDAESRMTEILAAAAEKPESADDMGPVNYGELALVNGPASLPVAMVLAHKLGHLFGAVACFDPKMGKYVVSIAHGGKYAVGQLIG